MKLATFERKYGRCEACRLFQKRHTIVLYRGVIPCQVLYVGEAPGKVENVLGEPFVGPAGRLLDASIEEVQDHRYAITNIISCIPWNEDYDGTRAPRQEEIEACAPRLRDFIKVANPCAIVLLGRPAQKHAKKYVEDLPTLSLRHPAWILRNGGHGSAEHNRFVLLLRQFLEDL